MTRFTAPTCSVVDLLPDRLLVVLLPAAPGSAMAQLVHVPAGRAGAVLTLARTNMPGVSSTGERSGAVVIPQCVGGAPGPTESEMPDASWALNHSASALAVPWSRMGSTVSASCGACAC